MQNQRFIAPALWETDFFHKCPAFQLLTTQFPLADQSEFPSLATLNNWLAQRAVIDVQCVSQQQLEADGRYYETFIAETGQIPTRQQNWHDLFGALIWALFPQTKALLNRLHQRELAAQTGKERSKLRHQLTLFDECGVVVLYQAGAQQLITALQQHQWLQALWQQAALWLPVAGSASAPANSGQLCAWSFGHANFEMLTRPYIGLTGKMYPLEVPDDFFAKPLSAQIQFVDTELCKQIASSSAVQLQQRMSPLPLLGIPGWYPQDAEFYQNSAYFRPKRQVGHA